MKRRVEYLDVARGVDLIFMIMFHCLGETILTFHHFEASTVLQVFLFVSGYFTSRFVIGKNIKKLVLPYFLTMILVRFVWMIRLGETINTMMLKQLFYQMILGHTVDEFWPGQSFYVGIIWFLPLFFVTKLIYSIVSRLVSSYVIKGIVMLTFAFIGIYIGNLGVRLPWSLDVVLAAMIFVYLGELSKSFEGNFFDRIATKYPIWGLLLVLQIAVVRCLGFSELATRNYPGGIMYIVPSMLSLYTILTFSRWVYHYIPRFCGMIQIIGKQSFAIMILHVLDKSCITYPVGMNIYLQTFIELCVATLPVLIYEGVVNKVKHER